MLLQSKHLLDCVLEEERSRKRAKGSRGESGTSGDVAIA